MEEPEVPMEQLHEEMHHHASHAENKWIGMAALTAAVVAALAAVTAMLSGHHANEAMLEQMKASDKCAYYQAKSIKSGVLQAKDELLTAEGKAVNAKDAEKLAEHDTEMKKIKEEATEEEESSHSHLQVHMTMARGVTLYQVAIAIVAIAVLTKRKAFWLGGVAFGLVGVVFLIQGLLMK
jgi:hypothetical protein